MLSPQIGFIMNLKLRITFLTTLLVILIGMLTLWLAGTRIQEQIKLIDYDFAEARTRTMSSIIVNRMDDLQLLMNSWTYWTELRVATEQNDQDFFNDELSPAALLQAGIGAVIVLDKKRPTHLSSRRRNTIANRASENHLRE